MAQIVAAKSGGGQQNDTLIIQKNIDETNMVFLQGLWIFTQSSKVRSELTKAIYSYPPEC